MREINIKRLYSCLVLILFAYAMTVLGVNKLLAYAELDAMPGTFRIQVLFYLLASAYVVVFYRGDKKDSIPERLALMFSCVCVLHAMLVPAAISGSILQMLIIIFSLPLSISLGKTLVKENVSLPLILMSLIVPFAIIVKNYIDISAIEELDISADISFSIVVFLPFIFLCKSHILNILFISVSGYSVLLTAKRSVIMALVLASLIYFYNRYMKGVNNMYQRVRNVLLIIFMIYAINLFFQTHEEESTYMLERFENLSEDGGSGRDKIYAQLVQGLKESYFEEKWFGHGHFAVESWLGHPAHNDYIEIMYDYGIVPLLLYIALIMSILAYAVKYGKESSDKMSVIGLYASVLMLLVLGLFNCFITNASYVFVIGLYIGIFKSRIEMDVNQRIGVEKS